MRLLICAGGTGGGVNPALAVLQAIEDKIEVLWVGSEGGMEADLVRRAGIAFEAIPAAGIHGIGIRQLPGNIWRLMQGFRAARRILKRFKPEVLFFTGGYVAVPMALAGRSIPMLLYVPDIEPGLAIKSIAHFADTIAITTRTSMPYFSRRSRLFISGYPTRSDLATWKRTTARRKLNLPPKESVLLVMGGSRGARSINQAVIENLSELLRLAQVVHISGNLDWPNIEKARKKLTARQASRYHAFPYLHEEMGAALASADLVISRAGASALGEYPLFGIPAVLIPYPYAWRYQRVNADYLAGCGAAVVLEDTQLGEELLPVIKNLLNNQSKRQAMQKAMQGLAQPQAAVNIARQLVALARKRSTNHG